MTSHSNEVFETMFSMKLAALPEGVPNGDTERVTGSVGFAGETINGAVYLHLPARFASLLAACLLGTSAEGLNPAEVNDAVGEITNMLTGGLKSWLCDLGAACAMSTPGIIRGNAYAIEAPPEVSRLCLGFSSGADRFCVEVHIEQQ